MKKIGNIVFAICLILLITMSCVVKPLSNLDEIWNFNIGRCIANGLVPYRDISMVSTPLLGFILAIPLKLFGQEMFYTRVVAIIVAVLNFFVIYKILKNLGIRKEIIRLIEIIILAPNCELIRIDYNVLVLLFILTIIYLEIKALKNEKWNKLIVDMAIGIFSGLAICSKQTIGIIISMVAIIVPVVCIKKKEDVINQFKKFFTRGIGIMLPIITFFIYLRQNGAFEEFLNYSVYGVRTFDNFFSYFDFFKYTNELNKTIAIIIPVTIIMALFISIGLKIKKREDSTCLMLALYSLAMFSLIYPISDITHFSVAIIPSILLLVYCLKLIGNTNKKFREMNFKYLMEFTGVCSMLLILAATLIIEYAYREELGMISKYDYQKHFRYIEVSANLNESIETINEFASVKEKKVYILDATAACYMIPIDRYNKDYDMFLRGNIGIGSEDAIIERIQKEDALYLIKKKGEGVNWQNPHKVTAYIRENMEYIGTKDCFDIYQNKEIKEENKEG